MSLSKGLSYLASYALGDVVDYAVEQASPYVAKIPVIGEYASSFLESTFLDDGLQDAFNSGQSKNSLTFDQFSAATATSAIGGSNFRSKGLGQAGQISMGRNGQVNTALNNPNVQRFLMSQARIKIPAATIKATNTIKLPTGVPKVTTKKKV
jgi:hypothetical protein